MVHTTKGGSRRTGKTRKLPMMKKTVSLAWAGAVEKSEWSDVRVGHDRAGVKKSCGSGCCHLLAGGAGSASSPVTPLANPII